MQSLELKVPPVAVGLLTAALMYFLATAIPGYPLPRSAAIIGFVVFAAAGLWIAFAGISAFKKAQTTVNPMNPEAVSSLVTSGIYQRTRNPMYVGMLLVLVGWSIFLSSMAAFVGLIGFVAYMNVFQIKPEERALTEKFGEEFEAYCKRSRRWL
ncbi:isoprenylcysteine carboxylmethyltransferase family protein [Rhodobacteraceae bacterium RKSG542]|nr:isoprenylcysteine carboxylmethyltransferase family protein [Pseudovibrio flavus]